MKPTLKKAWGHLKTINRHRHLVIRHCRKAGIFWQGLFHDLSKYTPTEFFAGIRYYSDGKKSPNEAQRLEFGYSLAWLHHKGRNLHHFEYWNDYNPSEGKVLPVPMPKNWMKELLCDRLAASKIYRGKNYTQAHPLDYFLKGKSRRFIAKETSDIIEYFLTVLAEQGEEQFFKELKKL